MLRFGWTLVLIYFYLTHTSAGFGRSFTQMDIIISLVPRLPSLRLSVRVCCEVMADKSLVWIYQKLLWRFIPPHFAISPGNFFFVPSRYGKLLIFHLHSFIIFFCATCIPASFGVSSDLQTLTVCQRRWTLVVQNRCWRHSLVIFSSFYAEAGSSYCFWHYCGFWRCCCCCC